MCAVLPIDLARLAVRQAAVVPGDMAVGMAGTDWRLHAIYDPAGGRFTDLDLTDGRGAQRFGLVGWAPLRLLGADGAPLT